MPSKLHAETIFLRMSCFFPSTVWVLRLVFKILEKMMGSFQVLIFVLFSFFLSVHLFVEVWKIMMKSCKNTINLSLCPHVC